MSLRNSSAHSLEVENSRRTSGRSVAFSTIDEEPMEYSLRASMNSNPVSDMSITVDDLDPRELQRHRASLDISPTELTHHHHQHHHRASTSTTQQTNHSNNPSSQLGRTPSSAGFVGAIRRIRHSHFATSILGIQSSSYLDENTTPTSNSNHAQQQHTNNRHTFFGGSASTSQVPPASERRTTLFTRQRHSIGTRSSLRASSLETSSESNILHNNETQQEVKYCLSDTKIHALRWLIHHHIWRGISLLFILILLFGPPIQDIWLPKTADAALDGIYTVAFVFLAVDIIIRSTVDKSYFSCQQRNMGPSSMQQQGRLKRKCGWCNVHAGSFMFWFDTVALLTLLYKLSYLNPLISQPKQLRISLNERGFPTNGNHATPIGVDWPLMLTVGRVGLMARFIRTSVLVQITSSFWWLKYFYPRYWLRKLAKNCHTCTRKKKKKNERGASDIVASQRALASSSRIRDDTNLARRTSDVSAIGDSRRSSSLSKRHSHLGGRGVGADGLEPFSEGSESNESAVQPVKQASIRGFFKGGFRRRSSGGNENDSMDGEASNKGGPAESLLFGNNDSKDSGSHVGAAMRELTGQRIATGALIALLVTVTCSWSEDDTTKPMTMLTLHGQTSNLEFAKLSVDVARASVIPTLFNYTRSNGTTPALYSQTYELANGNVEDLREREMLWVEVHMDKDPVFTSGQFDNSQVTIDNAKVELVTTILILFIWVLGVASFAGPVMTLVVEPIERMVRLLSMLMKDPLGYSSTRQYRKLKQEEDESADETMWPKEVLRGMETNFLMSTILRIGSLMRVGFGSAGVEIIRNNLERGRHKDVLFLNKQGGTVSCIFLFCDIRSFTDATECLQEEVFVFTNKIAAVIHSICHSYGGSANKNIGDAFLLSWLLDEAPPEKEEDEDDEDLVRGSSLNNLMGNSDLYANNNQADKALLSVVKISMALHYDKYFTEDMNEGAKNRLLAKLSTRKGPVVQMGFGLHAGKAVQGAIGSQRKLDATYISESVERAEFLESSTKQYGVPLLMSNAFYNLLNSTNRYRCRKVDQLLLLADEDAGLSDLSPHEIVDSGEVMNIYTFDMDIEALRRPAANPNDDEGSTSSVSERIGPGATPSLTRRSSTLNNVMQRPTLLRRASFTARELPNNSGSIISRGSIRRSSAAVPNTASTELETAALRAIKAAVTEEGEKSANAPEELVLPTGVHNYTERSWLEPDIKAIRRDYVANGIIFPKYQEGLKAYYSKDWAQAKQCFDLVVSTRDDGPSRYFLGLMEQHDGVAPRNFIGYGVVEM